MSQRRQVGFHPDQQRLGSGELPGKLLLVRHGLEDVEASKNVVEKQSAPFYFHPRVKAKEGGGKDSEFQDLGDQDDGGVICNNGDFEKS